MDVSNIDYVYTLHGFYGCECGCCGQVIITSDKDGKESEAGFRFEHLYNIQEVEAWLKKEVVEMFGEEIPIRLDLCAFECS